MNPVQSQVMDESIKLYRELRDYNYDKVLTDLKPKYTFNPNDVKNMIQPMLSLYKLINESAISVVPEPHLSNLYTQMQYDREKLLKPLETSNTERVTQQVFDLAKRRFVEYYPKTFEALRPYFAPSIMLRVNLDHLNEVVKQGKDLTEFVIAKKNDTTVLLTELKQSADDLVSQIKTAKDEGNEHLREIKNTLAEKGIIEQAANFKKTIDDHQWHSRWWLLTACVFAAILFCFAGYFLEHVTVYHTNDVGRNIQIGLNKLVLLGIFSYGLFVSIKNYQAHTHITRQ